MDTNSLLKALTSKTGISGYENNIADFALSKLSEYCDNCKIDKMGSVHGFIKGCGGENRKKIMLEAHMDQVGFLVTKIDDDGCISFTAVGGIDARILPCLRVKILGDKKTVDGVVIAPNDESVAQKNAEIKSLKIYTGYTSDELKKLISPGDAIVFDIDYMELLGDLRCCGSMDNRSGMTAVFKALEYIKQNPVEADIYVVFSTQEEIGLRGAYTSTYHINPDMAIAVDVTHGTTVDSLNDAGVFDLGSGAIILRGPNVDYKMTKELIDLAERFNIKHKIEVAGGASGTTAWAIQTVRCGVPVMLISIPLRYMHTNVEVLDTDDIEQAGKLMGFAAEYFGKEAK
ncbi:MAG: M20/M25/M40 family metallo-hydrolase [Clostridiales bacterium]|nr:M20/M25/M40 family metallo-hydrolase [Clostridiales bacterium]